MRLIKDMHLYTRPQTFGHMMDTRFASGCASWFDPSSALTFTAAAQDDKCWRFA